MKGLFSVVHILLPDKDKDAATCAIQKTCSLKPEELATRVTRVLRGKTVPRSFYDIMTVTADFDKGEKLGIHLKLDLVSRVDQGSVVAGKLKPADIILAVNGDSKDIKEALAKITKNGAKAVSFEIARFRTRFQLPSSMIPKGIGLQEGYDYVNSMMYYVKGLNIGLEIRCIENRVYVDKVDDNSIAGVTLGSGDCLLDIDGTVVRSTDQVMSVLKKNLEEAGFARLIVEVPNCDATKNAVRYKLQANAPDAQLDLPLPVDVMDIAKKHVEERKKNKPKDPKPILREKDKSIKQNKKQKGLKFNEKTVVTPVPSDAALKLLVKVPPARIADNSTPSSPAVGEISVATFLKEAKTAASKIELPAGTPEKTAKTAEHQESLKRAKKDKNVNTCATQDEERPKNDKTKG